MDAENPAIGKMSTEQLAGWLGLPAGTISRLLGPHGIGSRDGFEIREAVPILVAHLRDRAETLAKDQAADVARQKKAEADTAELELEAKLGKLVSKDEMKRLLEMAVVEVRERIRILEGLSLEQKRVVCDVIATLVLPAAELQIPE